MHARSCAILIRPVETVTARNHSKNSNERSYISLMVRPQFAQHPRPWAKGWSSKIYDMTKVSAYAKNYSTIGPVLTAKGEIWTCHTVLFKTQMSKCPKVQNGSSISIEIVSHVTFSVSHIALQQKIREADGSSIQIHHCGLVFDN